MVATKQKKLNELIKDAMDGRTVKSLAAKTGLHYGELTRKIKGDVVFRQHELDRINIVLGTDFKLI